MKNSHQSQEFVFEKVFFLEPKTLFMTCYCCLNLIKDNHINWIALLKIWLDVAFLYTENIYFLSEARLPLTSWFLLLIFWKIRKEFLQLLLVRTGFDYSSMDKCKGLKAAARASAKTNSAVCLARTDTQNMFITFGLS